MRLYRAEGPRSISPLLVQMGDEGGGVYIGPSRIVAITDELSALVRDGHRLLRQADLSTSPYGAVLRVLSDSAYDAHVGGQARINALVHVVGYEALDGASYTPVLREGRGGSVVEREYFTLDEEPGILTLAQAEREAILVLLPGAAVRVHGDDVHVLENTGVDLTCRKARAVPPVRAPKRHTSPSPGLVWVN